MSDKVFDAVVIGGGHHGTIIAPYLAKAGLKVAVFELLDHLGGSCVTELGPAPGFKMNFCAQFTRLYGHPVYKEFNLRDEGLQYVFPDTNEAIIFDDETAYMSYAAFPVVNKETGQTQYSEANVKKTYDSIAQFSKADADRYLELTEIYRDIWKPAFARYRYSPPPPYGTPDALEELFSNPKSGLDPTMQFMTCNQIAHYFFESDAMRILTLRGFMTSFGIFPDSVPGLGAIIPTIHLTLGWETAAVAKGASGALTDALVSAGKKQGVEYFVNADVTKVLVENGRATGIQLADGTQVKANKMVVADVGTWQLFERMLGPEYQTQEMRRRIASLSFDMGNVWWGAAAVHELPDYKVAQKYGPDINATPRTYWAPRDLEYFTKRYTHELYLLGISSKFFNLSAPDTLWDPSRAPEGKHLITFEEYTCPVSWFSRKEWRQMAEQYFDSLMEQWKTFAPNMTRDNIIGYRVITPVDLQDTHPDMRDGNWGEGNMCAVQAGRFRGLPGGYRTHIKDLYMCSSAVFGGGGIARGSSYNCYKIIAEDHNLRKPEF
jgi:phytoene dehydrogenase-like protein